MWKRLILLLLFIIPALIFFFTRSRYGSSTAEKFCRRAANVCIFFIVLSVPVSIFAVHVITSSEPGVSFTQALTRIWLFWAVPLGGFLLFKLGETAGRKGWP